MLQVASHGVRTRLLQDPVLVRDVERENLPARRGEARDHGVDAFRIELRFDLYGQATLSALKRLGTTD